MGFSKLKNKLLITLCIFVLVMPFYLVTFTYAADDTVNGTTIKGLGCDDSHNYFFESPSWSLTYYPVKKGYLYTINRLNDNPTYVRISVYSSSEPSANVPYTKLTDLSVDNPSFEYLSTSDGYISIVGNTLNSYSVIERNITGMNGAVNDLVDNVGIESFWEIFENVTPLIYIVVIFVFGYLAIKLGIRGTSKGKGGF